MADLPADDASALRQRLERGGPAGASLADYAETPRRGDWSLRSALVRFAQPEPTRAAAVLEVVRRTDAALHPHRRLLASTVGTPARDLDPEDRRALEDLAPVLGVALLLDGLADELGDWAAAGSPRPAPTARVDTIATEAYRRLDAAGVPREQRRPRRG